MNSSTVKPFTLGIPVGMRMHLGQVGLCATFLAHSLCVVTLSEPFPLGLVGPMKSHLAHEARRRNKVDLPQPLAPASSTHSPSSMWKEISAAKTRSP